MQMHVSKRDMMTANLQQRVTNCGHVHTDWALLYSHMVSSEEAFTNSAAGVDCMYYLTCSSMSAYNNDRCGMY